MVTWALEFENFYREQNRDESEIETRTSELFQYFYELDKGLHMARIDVGLGW